MDVEIFWQCVHINEMSVQTKQPNSDSVGWFPKLTILVSLVSRIALMHYSSHPLSLLHLSCSCT